jgi:CO dehydrogenase/acetyl-CoA synthase beta subunit
MGTNLQEITPSEAFRRRTILEMSGEQFDRWLEDIREKRVHKITKIRDAAKTNRTNSGNRVRSTRLVAAETKVLKAVDKLVKDLNKLQELFMDYQSFRVLEGDMQINEDLIAPEPGESIFDTAPIPGEDEDAR